MYVMGIDGGGTKTQCYVGTTQGQLLGEGFGGAANYQLCGAKIAKDSIQTAINHGLESAHLQLSDISYVVLGLSGADEPIDYDVLTPMCVDLLGTIPHIILNDTWIGLRSGSDFGVISICGTGGAHAGINQNGERLILRNLDYTLGNRGGGGDVVTESLHYAFRSNESTYIKTELEAVMPTLFDVTTMDEVCAIIREEGIPSTAAFKIPIETFRLANKGDTVATMILHEMGRAEGQYATGVIKRLGLETIAVPLVLIGGLFGTKNPILLDAYINEVRKVAPKAFIILPEVPPVQGAFLLAIDEMALNNH